MEPADIMAKVKKVRKTLSVRLDPEPVKEPVKETVKEPVKEPVKEITKAMVQEPPRVIREIYSTVREIPRIIRVTKTVARKPAKKRKAKKPKK